MSNTQWYESMAHIHAQDALWFVATMFVVGAIAIWISFKEDDK